MNHRGDTNYEIVLPFLGPEAADRDSPSAGRPRGHGTGRPAHAPLNFRAGAMDDPEIAPHTNRRRWARVDDHPRMEAKPDHSHDPAVSLPLSTVADVQDSLLIAMNDLQRLMGLLDHATTNLLERFNSAHAAMQTLHGEAEETAQIRQALHQAVTELQFHDMATQLLVHTGKILKNCAYKLAEEAMEMEEEESGLVETCLPERPNPVTQSEMDAGSIELF